jgi:hypothetical protein
VLRPRHRTRIFNVSDMATGKLKFMHIPLAGVATAGALLAAETIVATTVTSTSDDYRGYDDIGRGITGLFGATATVSTSAIVPVTHTVMVPAACSTFAAFCDPLALGCVAWPVYPIYPRERNGEGAPILGTL